MVMSSNVDVTSYIEKFESFFNNAIKGKINTFLMEYPLQKSLVIDYGELESYDRELADLLIKQPDVIIKSAELALIQSNQIAFKAAQPNINFEPHVRFFNLPSSDLLIQDISSKNIGELVSFKGVATKRGPVLHKVKVAIYKCQMCDASIKIPITKNNVIPQACPECKRRSLKLDEENSYFVDIQEVEVQELLERLPGGSPAATIDLWVEDDLVNKITPGENIEITGIMRLIPTTKYRTAQNDKNQIYTRYIETIHVKKTQKDFEEIEMTPEDENKIKELSTDPRLYEKIRESIAQGIYGHNEVKEALMLQLFGGTKDKFMPGGAPIRNDIHILLIGDPGSAKTRFLQYVNDIAPKGIFVSGKSVTGVGLTASAEKDERGSGGWTLKAGALVIASGGIAAIDEFDKIDEVERAAMHEVMESQRVSVAKAGMVAQFKAKTAILAAANPKYGRFDPNQLPGKQFDIPPTILSRFDLIFPIIDVLDEVKDAALAEYVLKSHQAGTEYSENQETNPNIIPKALLRKYISYARQHIRPKLTDKAMKKIKDFYVELRKLGKIEGAVPITPRQIEGLVRLSEASAKIRLSESVEEEDAERAIRLTQYVLEKVSKDRETGKLDIDIIATGRPKSHIDKINAIMLIAQKLQSQYGEIEIEKLTLMAVEEKIADEITIKRIIEDLIYKSELYKVRPGVVKIVNQSG